MLNAGIHTISLEDYVADPAPEPSLSASIGHLMLSQSPRHAWHAHPRLNPFYQPGESPRFDIGSAAHALLLEGDESRVVVIEADDWRTKVAKEARDAARAVRKLPILAKDMAAICQMVIVARKAIAGSELGITLADGDAEQTLLWQEGAIWLRSRPDWRSKDRRLVLDYKTTGGSAEPNQWMRSILIPNGYDIQAALALRGLPIATNVSSLLRGQETKFVFVVQECEPPYAVSFVGLAPAFAALAERKTAKAIELWGHCLATNTWPGYPSQVAWMEMPAWAEMQFAEREGTQL